MCSGQWAIRHELVGVYYLRACPLACVLYLLLYAGRLLALLPALLPACLLAAGLLLFVRWLPARSGRHGVEPTGGAKRNVETRCSKIAHVGIIILVLSSVRVLSAAACAIFEQRVSTLCLAPPSCSANCRPDLMQAWPACALLGCPLLCWAALGSLYYPGLSCRLVLRLPVAISAYHIQLVAFHENVELSRISDNDIEKT